MIDGMKISKLYTFFVIIHFTVKGSLDTKQSQKILNIENYKFWI